MNEQMKEAVREATSDVDLTLSDIPKIDLYLDQILSLVSEKNEQGSDRYKERMLTKTMINNYSKEGAILPIKGKKYNRMQVLQILFIYSLKSTLSIGEIKRMFDGANRIEGFGEAEFESLYADFLEMKEHSRKETEKLCRETVEALSLDTEKDEDYLRLCLSMVTLSGYLKNLAEEMIDVRFPVPAAEESDSQKDEKPTKAEKAKEKAAAKAEKAAEKAAAKAKKQAKDTAKETAPPAKAE